MTHWLTMLEQIRDTQILLATSKPFRDFSPVPNPRASEQAILAAEQRLGQRLPPSYRAFLHRHDGWPRFFDSASLLGTANLGKRLYEDLAWAAYEACQSPTPDGPPTLPFNRSHRFIPFGVDQQATTLFAFDPRTRRPDGEMAVIAWINEIGLRSDGFGDLLETLLELCQHELQDVELLRRSA
jgi:hypothetical protein